MKRENSRPPSFPDGGLFCFAAPVFEFAPRRTAEAQKAAASQKEKPAEFARKFAAGRAAEPRKSAEM